MRVVSTQALSAVNTASVTSAVILDTNQAINVSFQVIMGDATAAGTVKIQGSNDNPTGITTRNTFTPTNWSDIPNATSVIASGVGPMIVMSNIAFQWMRVVYTRTSGGSTTIIVNMNAAGA